MVMRDRSVRTPRRGRPAMAAGSATPSVTGTAAGYWLVRGKDGRLTAYARCEGGLLRWTEHRPGGPDWSAPVFFPVGDLTDLTVAQGADAYVHFLGRRERRAGGTAQVDLVHAVQYQTGRPLTEWRSLGNPHAEPDRAALLGPPAAAVDAGGDVHVFARNAGGGLMMRREGRGGRWEPWADLRGSDLRGRPAATAAGTGRVEVFAPADGVTLTWGQPEPGATPGRSEDVRPGALPGSAAALETAPAGSPGSGPTRPAPVWSAGAPARGRSRCPAAPRTGPTRCCGCRSTAGTARSSRTAARPARCSSGSARRRRRRRASGGRTPGGPARATRRWPATPAGGPCSPSSDPTAVCGWHGRAAAPD